MNIAMVLEMAADGIGDRRAIGSLTYAQVRAEARAVARRLAADAADATTLASLLPNGNHLPVALFGAAWAGVAYAPLNFRLPEPAQAELLARLAPAARFDESWMGNADAADDSPYVDDPDRPAVLLFTSGTSAAPKAAVLQHDNLTAYLFNTLEFASASEDEAALLAVPPFHIAGVAAVLSSTYVGRRLVPMARFDADDWLHLATEESVTHAFVVPTMLARIVGALEADRARRPPSLRSLAYGGARRPPPDPGRREHQPVRDRGRPSSPPRSRRGRGRRPARRGMGRARGGHGHRAARCRRRGSRRTARVVSPAAGVDQDPGGDRRGRRATADADREGAPPRREGAAGEAEVAQSEDGSGLASLRGSGTVPTASEPLPALVHSSSMPSSSVAYRFPSRVPSSNPGCTDPLGASASWATMGSPPHRTSMSPSGARTTIISVSHAVLFRRWPARSCMCCCSWNVRRFL